MSFFAKTMPSVALYTFLLLPKIVHAQVSISIQSQEQQFAVEKYIGELANKDKFVRRNAALELARHGLAAKSALPVLIEALGDREQQVWYQAVTAIARMGAGAIDASPTLIAGLNGQRGEGDQKWYRFSHALGMIGPLAIPQLKEAFHSDDAFVRAGAAKALSWMGEKALPAKTELLAALGDKNERVRQEAAEALAEIGTVILSELKLALKAEDLNERISAAIAIGHIGSDAPSALDDLVAALKSDDQPELYSKIIDALSLVGYPPPKFSPILLSGLAQTNTVIQQSSANAILRLGADGKALVPDLIQAMNSKDESNSLRAADVLGRMGSNAELAVPDLIRRIQQTSDADRRALFAEAIVRIGPVAFLPVLNVLATEDTTTVDDSHWVVTSFLGMGAALNSELATALNSEVASVRLGALIALKLIGPSAHPAEQSVMMRLKDSVPVVRAAAIEALSRIGTRPKTLLPQLEASFVDESGLVKLSAVRAAMDLGSLAGPFVPTLIRGLNDSENAVQLASIQALGSVGESAGESVASLTQRLSKAGTSYQAETIEALGKIGKSAEAAIPILLVVLESTQNELKPGALNTLASVATKTDRILERFKESVTDLNPDIRISALNALKTIEIPNSEMIEIATSSLTDDVFKVRETAGRILGSYGTESLSAAPRLFELLAEEQDRTFVLDTLRSIRSEDLGLITGILDHSDPEVRVYACQSLALMGNRAEAAVSKLETLRDKDADANVKREAQQALRRIQVVRRRN